MKKLLNHIYNKVIDRIAWKTQELLKDTEKTASGEQSTQLILKNQYRNLSPDEVLKYKFEDVGFRKYSQNGEDGILLFIFSVLGTANKVVVNELILAHNIQGK